MLDSIIERDDSASHMKIKFMGIKISVRRNTEAAYKKSQRNYNNVLSRLRKEVKSRPLCVIFLVAEKQKWGYQSLYEEMLKDDKFTPIVAASCVTAKHENPELERCSVDDNIEFFKDLGIDAESVYVNGEYRDLNDLKPDIIFYQQPWGLPELHTPFHISKKALSCYCSYSIATSKTGSKRNAAFFYTTWKYFLAHECMVEEYIDWMLYNQDSLKVTGHPKLDVYRNYEVNSNKQNKHYVIYAPHYSVGNSLLGFATFDWSGMFMLEYAKKHPEINWVFKPHPQLRSSFLGNEYMTEEELNNYFGEWAKIGMVCENGDYFDIFKDSDAMITDCGSFCVEYFFTGKPLFHLIAERSKLHSALNRLVNANHYSIYNKETLEQYLEEVLIKKNDFLSDVRQNAMKEIFNDRKDSAQNIINYLKEELGV